MTQVRGRVCSCTGLQASSVAAATCVRRRRSAVLTPDAVPTTTSRPRATATAPGSKDLDARVKVCLDKVYDDDDDGG